MNEGELKQHLEAAEKSPKQIAAAVSGLPDKTLRYKPAPDKWCILEILGHLADIEIVYAYRIRQMLADEKAVIAPMDRDDWARNLGYFEARAPARRPALPAATSAAAAFKRTISRRGDFFPLRISRMMAALAAGSPPARSSIRARFIPNSSGVTS